MSFDISVSHPNLSLEAYGSAETTFTVTNLTNETRRVEAKLATLNPQHKSWLKIEGDFSQQLAANGSHQYSVKVEVPTDKFKGRFDFRLEIYSALEPQEKLAQGPKVAVEVKPATQSSSPPLPTNSEKSKTPINPNNPTPSFPWLRILVVILLLSNLASVIALWQLKGEISQNQQQLASLKDTADQAQARFKQAQDAVDIANTKAAQAQEKADAAQAKAEQAQGTAQTAISKADTAQNQANLAISQANKAIQGVERYTDNNNGTVTDKRTQLVWLKNANCFGKINWQEANLLVKQLKNGKCDLSDNYQAGSWRLPSKEEWQVMVNRQYSYPSLSNAAGTNKWTEGRPFTGVKSNGYWSATPHQQDSTGAWMMELSEGILQTNSKTAKYYVWPVRNY
jgi:hypothetical protein